MVAWASSVFGILQSKWAQDNHVLLLSLSPFYAGHTYLRSFHTKQAHVPPASSIVWLGCHSHRTGRSCLWTLLVPGDVGPVWHHNQVFSDCSDCVSTPTKATPPPHTSYFCACNRQCLLMMAHLLQFPSSPFQCSTQMTIISCSMQLPI
jgi:hypothetical protein